MEKRTLTCCVQNGLTIEAYYEALKKIWDELHNNRLLMKERDDEKTHQFLMGLDDVYVPVRSNLLARDPLPPLNRVYELLIEEERRQTMKKSSALTCSVYSRRRRRRHLPEDLLPDILCRLPVKSLMRFRCVSKPWLALIDDGDFARLHLDAFKNNAYESRLFVMTQYASVRCSDTFEPICEITPLDELGNRDDLHWSVISSLDGLILLSYKTKEDIDFRVGLWNPSLRQFCDIPPLPPVDGFPINTEMGLGYDPLAKDYKLVNLIFVSHTRLHTRLHSVAIYTVGAGAGSWKIIPSSCSTWHWYYYINRTLHLHGRFYFFASRLYTYDVFDLVTFDLSNEVFSTVSLPDDLDFKAHIYMYDKNLFLVDGGSSMAVIGDKYVWVLERETMNWKKRCSYSLENTRILYVKKNGDMLTSRYRWEKMTDEVASYSPEKHEYILPREDI